MNCEILCSFIFFSFPTGAATPRTGVEIPRQIGMVNGGGPQSKPCQISGGSFISRYTLPAPPSGLSATSVSFTTVTLNWAAGYNSAAASYKVYVGEDSDQENFDSEFNVASGTLTKDVTGLTDDTLHYFWIQGVNQNGDIGDASLSSAGTFTTLEIPNVSFTRQRGTGSGRSETWTTDTNGETFALGTYSSNQTVTQQSSRWRVLCTGDTAGTTTVSVNNSAEVKADVSGFALTSATYGQSTVTVSSTNIYFQVEKSIYINSGGPYTITVTATITNNTVTTTVPISWTYTGPSGGVGTPSDRRLKTDIKKIATFIV